MPPPKHSAAEQCAVLNVAAMPAVCLLLQRPMSSVHMHGCCAPRLRVHMVQRLPARLRLVGVAHAHVRTSCHTHVLCAAVCVCTRQLF